MKSVSSSTYSSEYQLLPYNPNNNPYGTINLRRHPVDVASVAASRLSLNTYPTRKFDDPSTLRRHRTLLSHKTYRRPSILGRDDSFSSGTSNESVGSKQSFRSSTNGTRRGSGNSLEELFHIKPEARMEKKYRSIMLKKLDKALSKK